MIDGVGHQFESASTTWKEHLRTSALSIGTYSIPVGGDDDQVPHREAEVYVVLRGRATLTGEHENFAVDVGTVVYAQAGEAHRFTAIEEHLVVLVIFAPAYSGR